MYINKHYPKVSKLSELSLNSNNVPLRYRIRKHSIRQGRKLVQ